MAALDKTKLKDGLVYLTANRRNLTLLDEAVKRNQEKIQSLRPLVLLELMVLLEAVKEIKEVDERRSVNGNWGGFS